MDIEKFEEAKKIKEHIDILKRRKYGLELAIKSNSLSVQVSYKEDYDRPALLYIHDRNFIKEMMEKELDSVNQELLEKQEKFEKL
jgi:hypothetical protein